MGQSLLFIVNTTLCFAIIMFGKLTQFKNFISHAVTSLTSQKPEPPTDPQLDKKLKFLLDYILRNPVADQFKAYHSLQAPEMTLNELLKQIYTSGQADTAQIASILHFFTFLLINCNNQLVLCKIVSDSFVIELTEVQLNALGEGLDAQHVEIEEINSYKIALIKAYVSRINEETIKYMVIKDRMQIFENCVTLYEEYMRVEEEEQFGVEATCISNCILLIVKYLAAHPEHAPNISYQEGNKGIVYLLVRMVQNVHRTMKRILDSSELEEQPFEMLKDKILFLVDIFSAIASEDIRSKIISETSKELADLRQLFKEIVLQHTAVLTQSQPNYIKSLELIKVLLKLLNIYYQSEELLPLFSECLLPLLHKFKAVFKPVCEAMAEEVRQLKCQRGQSELQFKEIESCLVHKQRLVYIFCANMEIVACIMRGGQYLMRRNTSEQKERELKGVMVNMLVDVLELLLGESGESIKELLCYKSIKFLLQSLMQVTIENEHTLHEYSVVKFHQFAIDKLRRELKNNELWDTLVLHYESYLRMINQNLLTIEDTSPHEYSFCQFHDPGKIKLPSHNDILTNAIFINECARNFRFMIVEKSSVSTKDIKLEKNYHNNFITPGWGYEPGKEVSEPINEVCHLSHLSKGMKIPICVLEDEDCLLFAHSEGDIKKVLLNIRFKSIEGFTGQKDLMVIKLKGLQEVLVQAGSKKQRDDLKVFKQYLIQKRDRSRERELKFIHHYLDIYYQDNQQIIEQMGQAEIQSDLDLIQSASKITESQVVEDTRQEPTQLLGPENRTQEPQATAEGGELPVAGVVDDL